MKLDSTLLYDQGSFDYTKSQYVHRFTQFHKNALDAYTKEQKPEVIGNLQAHYFEVRADEIILRVELWIKWDSKENNSATVICKRINPHNKKEIVVDDFAWDFKVGSSLTFDGNSVSISEFGHLVIKHFLIKAQSTPIVEAIW